MSACDIDVRRAPAPARRRAGATAAVAARRGSSQRVRNESASTGSDWAWPINSAMICPARPRNAAISTRIWAIRSAGQVAGVGKVPVWR